MSRLKTSTQAPRPQGRIEARAPAEWLARLRGGLDAAHGAPSQSLHGDEGADLGEAARAAARPAAVLAPLVEENGALHVILTVRPTNLPRHPGQISFPGGRVGASDSSLAAAALRETHEEIGIAPDRIELLGRWEPYLTGSGFLVTPFAGLVAPDAVPRACPNEVEEIFTAPLDFLMDAANYRRDSAERGGVRRRFYAIGFGDYYIWGATAGMLRALHHRLSDAQA